MWYTSRVQRDRRTFDTAPAAEVTIDVVQHLFAVDIAMVIRDRYREWMVVQFARYKRADDKIRSLEGLVHGRRLVDAPGDRLEVSNIEDPGVLAAVPTDGIDGVKVIPVAGNKITYFHAHLKIATLGMRFQLFWAANIALTIGGVLQHLTVFIEIAMRRFDCAMRLDD